MLVGTRTPGDGVSVHGSTCRNCASTQRRIATESFQTRSPSERKESARRGCTGMSDHTTHIPADCLHETLLRDWAAEGLAAVERYLAKHAAFAAFLEARTVLESNDGHRADQR